MSNRRKVIPNNNRQANVPNAQIQAQVTQVTHQGPIPHPEILRGYDELVSGAAERIIKLAEDESAHRRLMESKALEANIVLQEQNVIIVKQQNSVINRSDILGQIFGFIICIACVGAAIYLGMNKHDWLAGIIAAVPSAALLKTFFSSKNHQQHNKPSE